MKTKQIRKDKCSYPKVKSVEEKRFRLHHCLLAVFETSIISFTPKPPHMAWRHNTTTLWMLPKTPLQQANKSTTRLRIIQDSLTGLKIPFHKAQAISQWKITWKLMVPDMKYPITSKYHGY
jgi:hypothetical protein